MRILFSCQLLYSLLLVIPITLYICFLVSLVSTVLLLNFGQWRRIRIWYVFQISPKKNRICFLQFSYIDCKHFYWQIMMRRCVALIICLFVYKYHHHHHAVLVARISLTLSHHFSLSFIASGRSSGKHPVSSHSCWMDVRAGRPAFARPCVGVHKSTSLMSSSLLLQQCPACLVRLTWIVFVIGGRWPLFS